MQLTHILCYPLSRLSGASAWEERWGTARSYMGSTRNYWCQENTAGEMKWCISNSLEGFFPQLVFFWKGYDQKNRALGYVEEDQGVIPIGQQVFGLLFEAGSVNRYFLVETPSPVKGIWYKASLVCMSAVIGEFLSEKHSAATFLVLPGLWVLTCCSLLGVAASGKMGALCSSPNTPLGDNFFQGCENMETEQWADAHNKGQTSPCSDTKEWFTYFYFICASGPIYFWAWKNLTLNTCTWARRHQGQAVKAN